MIYCDTSTLLNNIKRHNDAKSVKELEALEKLLALHAAGKIRMVRSREALRELQKPPRKGPLQPERVARLRADYDDLNQIALDEKVLGFDSQFDQRGEVSTPLVQDVQDAPLRDELVGGGLDRSDAAHIAQAVANKCQVFLTRDEKSIIKHREWLERRLAPLKIRRPSELIADATIVTAIDRITT